MRLSQTPSVSLAKARERRKLRPPPSLQSPPPDLQRSRTRSKKKHKRLDAIRDRVIEPIEHEGSVGRSPGPVVSDSVSVRRSTRVRRPTVVSDFSPLPVKKRNKFKRTANFADVKKNEGSVDRKSRTGKRGLGKVSESPNSGDLQEMGSWGSRLRSRVRNDSTPTRETRSPVRGKRKLFKELDEFRDEEELIDVKENERSEGRVIRGTKSRRMDWKKELIDEKNEDQNTGPSNSKECNKDQFLQETLAPLNNEATATLGNTIDGGSDTIMGDGSAQGHNKMDVEGTSGVGTTVPGNDQLELPNCEPVEGNGDDADRDNSRPSKASTRAVLATNPSENDGCQDRTEAHLDELASKHIEDQNGTREAPQVIKVDKLAFALKDSKLDRLRIREGRRCGLCGGGTDGKPPKKLVRDSVDSDNELSGGSSAPEEPNYDMWDGFGDEPGWLGPLLGPIHDRFGIAGVWVHQHCAVWSPEVYFADLGCLKNVRAALFRGRALKCSRCGRPGATIGCRVDRCPKTYHLPCSRADGCIFDHRKFLIACTDHRRLFQPQGTEYLRWINRRKAKKMRSDMKKLSVDGCRKDFEAEEKWLENCGEDEEFLRREGKRLHRDITRIAPVYIGGSPSEGEKPYQGWESVAGLKDVIQCLKEVVILPLLYPEFFSNLGLTPPRGVLLHGYPGTGKTLVVRALIGACSCGDKKIAYFARKGADCLGKYVGDAERQLRLLFQVAERSQPSIIFFDEIDGLAPCRSSQQDQTHSSVVSTLLALLDGLKSRGSVIVIGATNRPEAVDPALRRPGRFDREIFFPLPSAMDRSAILSLHTQKWPKPVSGSLLKWIADQTPGFAGADLQALCTQAAMIALKRNCALHELLSAAEKYPNHGRRFPLPSFYVDERDWLAALASAPPPCSRREAGIAANGVVFSPLHKHLLPCLLQPLSYLLISLYLDGRIQLSPPVYKAAELINRVIVSAMEQKKMPTSFWQTYLHNLVQDPDVAREIERNLSRTGLLVGTFGANCDLLDDDNDCEEFEFQKLNPSGACIHPSLVQNTSYSQDCPSGFRLLVAGGPRSGQQNLASCLLHGFLGHVEIQKINLATLSLEGHGDLVQGMTRILLKCLSLRRCIIYMPRIDLWAVHDANHKSTEEESGFCQKISKPTLTAELRGGLFSSSQSWNSFVEQVDSMSTSVSFTIMATCEMPNHVIPLRIRQFFTNDVLNCKDSASSQHTIPRFLVQVDGSFSRDLVIDSSATKLLHDLVQQCVQLIHHRSHKGNTTTLKEFNIVDSLGVNLEVENCKMGNTTSNGAIDKPIVSERIPLTGNACKGNHIQQSVNEGCPLMSKASCHLESMVGPGSHKDSISRVIPNRVAKGKATLLLTIATFGYQILRYPHFAELCWATSKLKEGPCTGVNGPWKIWPFNSCIIRADNSLEKDAVGCNSINHKNRECSGAVRGLVAVGLLAYKGVYTSIREVSSEVRKVLELLVGEINKKIQGGKDRWRFLRLLSQVAYFEDMVNSWAYGLRSLDIDCEMSASNIRSVTGRTLDRDNHRCGQNPVENDACVPSVYDKSEQAANILAPEQSPTRLSNENCRYGDGFDKGISVVGISGPSEGMVPMSPCPSGLLHSDVSAGLLDSDNTLKEKNDKNHLQRSSENPMILEGTGSLKQSNGLAVMDATPLSQDAFCNLDGSFVMDNSRSGKGSAQCNGMPVSENIIPCGDVMYGPDERVGVVNCNLRESDSLSALSEICLYKCCPECLRAVHVLIREIVIDSLKSCSTVGDVHDAVAACSVGVLAAVRKHFVAERQTNTEEFCGLGLKHGTCCEHCSCWEVGDARIRKTSNMSQGSVKRKVVPMECICHSVSREVTTVPNTSKGSHLGSGLKFFFKDSALMPSDRDRDAVLHCKFESLCLCPIIDGILMIKQRLGLMCYSQFKLA